MKKVFVSFEFEKDNQLKEAFISQAKGRIEDLSIKHSLSDNQWVNKAQKAIAQCQIFVVLIGQDTHNAPGVKKEVRMANRLQKRMFQVRPQKRKQRKGVKNGGEVYSWKWKTLDKLLTRSQVRNDNSPKKKVTTESVE